MNAGASIPTPSALNCLRKCLSFRILGEILRITDPDKTRFVPLMGHWTDGSKSPVLPSDDLTSIVGSISPTGVLGLQHLLSFRLHLIFEDLFYDLQTLDPGTQ